MQIIIQIQNENLKENVKKTVNERQKLERKKKLSEDKNCVNELL